jgi:hypothetical protein
MHNRLLILLCLLVVSGCVGSPTTQIVILPNNSAVLTPTSPPAASTQELAASETETTPIYPFEDLTDPLLTVASYYNAINLREFERAYSYRENDPVTLDDFSDGFAETERVEVFARYPVRIGAAAGNEYADVPVLLIAANTNGTQQQFIGCLVTHITNVPSGPQGIVERYWGIVSDVESLGRAGLRATDSTDLSQLETACDAFSMDTSLIGGTWDDQTTPMNAIGSYFNALALGDVARAYGYWDQNPSITQDELAARYAGMTDGVIYMRLTTIFGEGAAGSAYLSLPMFLIAQHGDEQHISGGCLVLRHSNVPAGVNPEPDPDWWITRDTLTPTDTFDLALTTCE